jgi:cobalamin-dependent methionine synthase I
LPTLRVSAGAAGRPAGSLGENNRLWPEQSTYVIVLQHFRARYFNV